MFDVGFSELVVIALVALIVIGPERLPKVARMAGHLLGRLQRYVNDVKADINREMQLEELKKLQNQLAEQARAMETSVTHEIREAESALNQTIAAPVAETVAAAGAVLTAGVVPAVSETLASPPGGAALADDDAARQLDLGLGSPSEKPRA